MSSNLEKIKQLGAEISSREEKDAFMKKECLSCLIKIKNMLCGPKTSKRELKKEIDDLISKLS